MEYYRFRPLMLATTLMLFVLVQSGCFNEVGTGPRFKGPDVGDADASAGSVDVSNPVPTGAPEVTILAGPPPRTAERWASFEFACNLVEGCIFACNLDSTGFRRCTSPTVFDNLVEGTHKFEVVAYDEVGNRSSPQNWSWIVEPGRVDENAPEIRITEAPPERSPLDSARFAFECVGRDDCTFQCALVPRGANFDQETMAWQPCSSPHRVEGLEPGDYLFYIWATTAAGMYTIVRHGWTYSDDAPLDPVVTWPTAWTAIATGTQHTCGIGEEGSLWCWGGNNSGELGIGPPGAGERDYRRYPSEVDAPSRWKAISAGLQHSCGIREDSSMWCWGWGFVGQLGDGRTSSSPWPVRAGTDTNWVSISAGSQYNCGIRDDGTLWCWGSDSWGRLGLGEDRSPSLEPAQVGADTDWSQVSARAEHTCAVRQSGTLWCWGRGAEGQLGIGSTEQRNTPTRVGDASDWASVSAGGKHTCALRTDGSLWCWGQGAEGRLGHGDRIDRDLPTRVGEANTWETVTAGSTHTCAITTDGALWCWGRGGQLGLDDLAYRTEPARVGEEEDWMTVVAGGSHGCGLREDGSLWCWGATARGQLGIDDALGDQHQQVPVVHTQPMRKVSANGGHSCGIGTDGSLWCWGANWAGQLGLPAISLATVPAPIGSEIDWRDVAVGGSHTCAVREDGTLWCWGGGRSGQLGLGNTLDHDHPTRVGTGTNWERISAGTAHTCGLRSDGTLWCWGFGDFGRLGLGDHSQSNVPVQVGDALNWADVSAGLSHTCGLQNDGTLWCWGRGDRGALGLGDTLNRYVPTLINVTPRFTAVSAGSTHTCAIDSDGSSWCWGSGSFGNLGVGGTSDRHTPTPVAIHDVKWTMIAAGGFLTCGLLDDGSLWCWGASNRGAHGHDTIYAETTPKQVGSASDWIGVATGSFYGLAIRSDGNLWAWGANDSGQLGEGTARILQPFPVLPP